MCVYFWDPYALKIFVERCSWELNMLFGSLVELHTWLHSCPCFSPLKKLFLKSWLNTSSIASYLSSFLKLFLIAISTAPRHLVDRSSIILASGVFLPRQLLDTWSVNVAFSRHLLDRCLDTTSTPHLLRITDALYILLVRFAAHFYRSLSRYLWLFISRTSLTHSKPLPLGFSSFFKSFFTW